MNGKPLTVISLPQKNLKKKQVIVQFQTQYKNVPAIIQQLSTLPIAYGCEFYPIQVRKVPNVVQTLQKLETTLTDTNSQMGYVFANANTALEQMNENLIKVAQDLVAIKARRRVFK